MKVSIKVEIFTGPLIRNKKDKWSFTALYNLNSKGTFFIHWIRTSKETPLQNGWVTYITHNKETLFNIKKVLKIGKVNTKDYMIIFYKVFKILIKRVKTK